MDVLWCLFFSERLCFSAGVWAAWAQALFSILAVFVAVLVAQRQSVAARAMLQEQFERQEEERRINRASAYANALNPVVFMVKELEGIVTDALRNLARDDMSRMQREEGENYDRAYSLLDRLLRMDVQKIPIGAGSFIRFAEHAEYACQSIRKASGVTDDYFSTHRQELLQEIYVNLERMREYRGELEIEFQLHNTSAYVTRSYIEVHGEES